MSVFKSKKSAPYYWFDFQLDSRRFYGSTRCTTRKEAEKIEQQERERAKVLTKAAKISAVSLAIDHVAARFWNEVGQHHAGRDATSKNLARLVSYFGKATPLTDIDDAAVAKLVAWRRGQRIKGREKAPFISTATVNRSTTKVLKRLFSFAKSERAQFESEPNWTRHWLKEPPERVRVLVDHGDRVAGLLERAGELASHSAAPHDHDVHESPPGAVLCDANGFVTPGRYSPRLEAGRREGCRP